MVEVPGSSLGEKKRTLRGPMGVERYTGVECHTEVTCCRGKWLPTFRNLHNKKKIDSFLKMSKRQKVERYKSIIITLNNPELKLQEFVDKVKGRCTYDRVQLEEGENKTPHFQGVFHLKNQMTLTAIKAAFGECHVEKVADWPKAIEYCGKEDTRKEGPIEWGDAPQQGRRTDLEELATHIREGANMAAIADRAPTDFIRYHKGLQAYMGATEPERNWKTRVILLTGAPGSGKTSTAQAKLRQYGAPYFVRNKTDGTEPWWDGYDKHQGVIWDEYRSDPALRTLHLRLFDRYPHHVPYKGGFRSFLARVIILTCVECPFGADDSEMWRRIDHWIDEGQARDIPGRGGESQGDSEPVHWGSVMDINMDSWFE